jgi:lincosamide nucleotidyltransferase A/C/D/E
MTEMTSEDVVELLQRLEQHDVVVWLDGGWGVDALLGEQTRPHGDVGAP